MRLKCHTQPSPPKLFPSRFQGGGDGRGVMGVVVHQGDTAPRAPFFESSANARELSKAMPNLSRSDTDFKTECCRRKRIQHIVFAMQRKDDFRHELSTPERTEAGSAAGSPDIAGTPVGLHRPAEREDHRWTGLRGLSGGSIIRANQQHSAGMHPRSKQPERGDHVVRIREAVEVIRFNTEDRSIVWRELEETALKFAAFHDEQSAVTTPRTPSRVTALSTEDS